MSSNSVHHGNFPFACYIFSFRFICLFAAALTQSLPLFSDSFTSYHKQSQLSMFLDHHIPRLNTMPFRKRPIRVRNYPDRRPKTMQQHIPPTLLPTNLSLILPDAYPNRPPNVQSKSAKHALQTSRITSPSTSPLPTRKITTTSFHPTSQKPTTPSHNKPTTSTTNVRSIHSHKQNQPTEPKKERMHKRASSPHPHQTYIHTHPSISPVVALHSRNLASVKVQLDRMIRASERLLALILYNERVSRGSV